MEPGPLLALLIPAWVGHAYLLTGGLNNLYARPLSKLVLRPVRLLAGVLILAFPVLGWEAARAGPPQVFFAGPYLWLCAAVGAVWFPYITAVRATRRPPACVRSEQTETLDLGAELGPAAVGNGKHSWFIRRLPVNHAYRVDFTELTLAVPGLPPGWDGLTVLVVSDVHFHGTPSRLWFDRVFDRITAWPTPDVVVLAGDYLDSDRHRPWVGELLGRLRWAEVGVAVLGNHDKEHDPARVRKDLADLGFQVVSNRWELATVRGERCVLVGHEGPWLGPPPDVGGVPAGAFTLCVSHTPDHFPWAVARGYNLVLCGHVHGGQIRVPLVGSIFVPSRFGRRYDMGVFADKGTVMVVGRGLSGKEAVRWRCHPQVIRLTLTPG